MKTPTTEIAAEIAAAAVTKVYAGRPGCACGCRGRYSERPAQIKKIKNILIERAGEVEVLNISMLTVYSLSDEYHNYFAYVEPVE